MSFLAKYIGQKVKRTDPASFKASAITSTTSKSARSASPYCAALTPMQDQFDQH